MAEVDLATLREFVIGNFLFGDATGFSDDTSFRDESILDSTGILELIAFLEKAYRIRIDDDELTPENLDSLNRIEAFVKRKLAPTPA